jgi:REP element-mobilizing transposase RayT
VETHGASYSIATPIERFTLKLLRENMDLYGVALIGYCLMSNHVHLIAKMAMDPEIEETALVSGWVR